MGLAQFAWLMLSLFISVYCTVSYCFVRYGIVLYYIVHVVYKMTYWKRLEWILTGNLTKKKTMNARYFLLVMCNCYCSKIAKGKQSKMI